MLAGRKIEKMIFNENKANGLVLFRLLAKLGGCGPALLLGSHDMFVGA